jgi:hypothetical protein
MGGGRGRVIILGLNHPLPALPIEGGGKFLSFWPSTFAEVSIH